MTKKSLIMALGSTFLFLVLTSPPCLAASLQWPKSITILVSGGMTSGSYVGTIAWASVMEKETGMKVRVVPEAVFNKRSRDVKSGRALFQQDGMQAIARQIEALPHIRNHKDSLN